jgi:hypothetical protein
MQYLTAVCRECKKRFPLPQNSNQHHRGGSPRKSMRFCSSACKQSAYRKRSTDRSKSVPATTPHAAVTRHSQIIENIEGIRASKTVCDVEIYAPHHWEDRVSSDGVPILVSQLRQSVLVRT